MKKHFFSMIVIVFACITTASAQYDFSKVDNWLEENTPNMGGRSVLMIYKDGKIIYTKAVNELSGRQKMVGKFMARRLGKTINTDDFTSTTKQMIASCSKWYSAALVMTFVDEGKLKLTDTVGKYLPVLTQHGKGNITIAQCLSHTTGIKAPDLKESLQEWKNVGSMDEAIAQIASLPMEGKPGTVFHYSNAGLQIAGAVIEKISGKSFETLFAERIAMPLAMKNTDFGNGKVALPAGGGRSTAEDYMNFLVMILNKGTFNGKRILNEGSVVQMQVNRLTPDVKIAYSPAEAGGIGYGFGEWIVEKSAVTGNTTTVSSPGLFGSFPWVDNERKYAAFLLTFYIKNDGRQERYKQLRTLVNEAIR
ncbi:beta-lactamase family protein [Mucilaginibacter sp. RS28]|uniref:Beta-lactamase family protein n=1 Tax=Mucilaginibacter straminoryzae TaxID=2932774 RepID=A0A9X1X0C2_9SPHI|nr:serine hydrolase domain-containing protein [Mucilaginibacter straminoryzae]MCJ8208824.1 beta-lactamase family protein [Mucilaginibacter straminoryzae]